MLTCMPIPHRFKTEKKKLLFIFIKSLNRGTTFPISFKLLLCKLKTMHRFGLNGTLQKKTFPRRKETQQIVSHCGRVVWVVDCARVCTAESEGIRFDEQQQELFLWRQMPSIMTDTFELDSFQVHEARFNGNRMMLGDRMCKRRNWCSWKTVSLSSLLKRKWSLKAFNSQLKMFKRKQPPSHWNPVMRKLKEKNFYFYNVMKASSTFICNPKIIFSSLSKLADAFEESPESESLLQLLAIVSNFICVFRISSHPETWKLLTVVS